MIREEMLPKLQARFPNRGIESWGIFKAEFLELLFADRVLIHKSGTDGSAGWEVFDSDDFSRARLSVTDRTYLWSGPIESEN